MSWSLDFRDYIGVELALLEPPELEVFLETSVVFPDIDPMGVYTFPSLYYQVLGPTVDETPKLLSQVATDGGLFAVEAGAEKFRVYLQYDAAPGPLGTLPHGDIRKSIIIVKAGNGYTIPSLGERHFTLTLDTSSTRITMIEGTTLAVPAVSGATVAEPVVNTEVFFQSDTVGGFFYWSKLPLVERPVHDIALRLTSYLNPKLTSAYDINSASNTANSTASTFNLPMGNRTVFIQAANGAVSEITNIVGSSSGAKLIPANTAALFVRSSIDATTHNNFMSGIGANPIGSAYYRNHFESVNNSKANRGKNWRIPTYTFTRSYFAGRSLDDTSWKSEIA